MGSQAGALHRPPQEVNLRSGQASESLKCRVPSQGTADTAKTACCVGHHLGVSVREAGNKLRPQAALQPRSSWSWARLRFLHPEWEPTTPFRPGSSKDRYAGCGSFGQGTPHRKLSTGLKGLQAQARQTVMDEMKPS